MFGPTRLAHHGLSLAWEILLFLLSSSACVEAYNLLLEYKRSKALLFKFMISWELRKAIWRANKLIFAQKTNIYNGSK